MASPRGIMVSARGAIGASVDPRTWMTACRVMGTDRMVFTTVYALARSARDWMSEDPSSGSPGVSARTHLSSNCCE